jgi:hypothetical protein
MESWEGVNRHGRIVPEAYCGRIAYYLPHVSYYFKGILFE